jgi:hypothetical protein
MLSLTITCGMADFPCIAHGRRNWRPRRHDRQKLRTNLRDLTRLGPREEGQRPNRRGGGGMLPMNMGAGAAAALRLLLLGKRERVRALPCLRMRHRKRRVRQEVKPAKVRRKRRRSSFEGGMTFLNQWLSSLLVFLPSAAARGFFFGKVF